MCKTRRIKHDFFQLTLKIVVFNLRWQHTMAIFTTQHLPVVLSTILWDRGSVFYSFKWTFSQRFLPSSRVVSTPQHLPSQVSHFWPIFVVLAGLSVASLRPASTPLSTSRSSVVCPPPLCLRLSSFSGSAHSVQRKPASTSSPAPANS